MMWLRQSTAATVKIGPFTDSTDGNTAETALTIAQADVRLSKNGGDIAQKNDATSCTHDELGIYGCPINTTDTATLGRLQLWVHESGALPVWHEFMVVPANVWDSFFGSDMLKVDVHSIDDDAAAADNAEAFFDGTGYAGTGNVIPTVTALTGHTAQTGDNYARLGAPAGASIAADLVTIDNFVDDLETRLTAARAGYLDELASANVPADIDTLLTRITAAVALASVCTEARLAELDAANLPTDIAALPTTAEVNAEVDTALADIDLDHLIQVTAGAEEPTDGSYLDQIMHKDVSQTFDPTTDSLEAIRDTAPLGTAMRGTDSAALASICTEARLAELDAANLPTDVADIPTVAEFNARTQPTADYFDPATDTVANVTLVATTTTNSDMRGTDNAALASVCTETRLAELAAANLPADIAALPTTAEVNTEVDTALADIHLDHLLAVDYDPASKPGTATALLNELVESDVGVSRFTANALEEAPTGGSAPTVEEIADQVWDEDVVAAHNTANTAGALIDDIATKADFKATGFSTHSAAGAADAVWDEAKADHVAAGSLGEEVQAHATPAEVDTECDEALTNYGGPTNAQMEARTLVAASYFDPAADAVANVTLVATTTTNSDMRGTDSAALASVCTEARLAELAAANLPADVAALPAVTDITQRQIPDSIPADGTLPTIEQALYMVTQFLYERAVVDTTVTVKKVDGSTSLLTLTLDDGTDPTSITRAS